MRASSLIERFAHFHDARKIFWILLLTGKIKTKGKYRNDKKVGEWTTFYRDVYYPNQN